MKSSNNSIQQIDEIKEMMERSSRFISLSGLSGISAGAIALAGVAVAFFHPNSNMWFFDTDRHFFEGLHGELFQSINFLLIDALAVLFLALSSAIFFTVRKARLKGQKVWTRATRLLLYNIFVPLIVGGLFCLMLIFYKLFFLIAPVSLIFYGLALFNGSKYTLPEIQWLGLSEILIGLMAFVFIGYSIFFWALGFGILHIVYGATMYNRYEANNKKKH